VQTRIVHQWTDEEKERLADFKVVNDGVQAIIPQVLELDRFFRSQRW